jgi:hypothetical protein
VYDLFYKLPALQAAGVLIHLHCFDYGRGKQPELEKYCYSVNYYERYQGHIGLFNTLPYIVASRKNEQLMATLLKDDYPIIMEGVHCSYPVLDKRFLQRKLFVRLHNVEFSYYHDLFRSSRSLFRKMYYWIESRLLKTYEKKIARKAFFWTVTEADAQVYQNKLGCKNATCLPLFLPPWEVAEPEGMGSFCLYHGDLSIEANEQAAIWLLSKVLQKTEIPFIIAGKNPSARLMRLAAKHPHTCLVANPSEDEMQDLISKAHIHLVPSYTRTGIKLKLVNALYNGRHCVVNEATVAGSGLETACHIGTTANAFTEIVAQLYHQPPGKEETLLRKKLLQGFFNNEVNAKKMIGRIWGS